jgi:hypothetical protein
MEPLCSLLASLPSLRALELPRSASVLLAGAELDDAGCDHVHLLADPESALSSLTSLAISLNGGRRQVINLPSSSF